MSVTVDVSAGELLDGYHQWLVSDPKHSPLKPGQHFTVKTPAIDLYDRSGSSVYYGANSDENAAFIRGLPATIHQHPRVSEMRPSIDQAFRMFKELDSQRPDMGRYTLFSVQIADKADGSAQSQALQQLKQRAGALGVRVIDVRVKK